MIIVVLVLVTLLAGEKIRKKTRAGKEAPLSKVVSEVAAVADSSTAALRLVHSAQGRKRAPLPDENEEVIMWDVRA